MSILPSLPAVFQHSDKYKRLVSAKRLSFPVLGHYYNSEFPLYQRYAERILNCSPQVRLVTSLELMENTDSIYIAGQSSIKDARWCHVRHCPMCQFARISKYRARYFQAFSTISNLPRFCFYTVTIANCPLSKLRETLAIMTEGWDRLMKRRNFPITGFLRSMEVTIQREKDLVTGKYTGPPVRSESGELMAHPHFHVLMSMVSDYFVGKSKGPLYQEQQWWVDEWRSALRVDYQPIVYISPVKPRGVLARNPELREIQFIRAVLETLKYTVKPTDFNEGLHSPEWLYGVTQQLHGLRSLRTGGWFAKLVSQKELDQIADTCRTEQETTQTGDELLLDWNSERRRFNVTYC